MFKLKNLSLLTIVLFFTLSSCSKDSSTSTPQNQTAAIEGKWQFTKEGTMTNNQEVLTDYQHTSGCTKDYEEILTGGVAKEHLFDNPNCQETIDTGSWTKTNNSLVLTYPNSPIQSTINAEIMELTNTTLKVKYPLSGSIHLVIFTRIQ